MNKELIITISGATGSGKSTIAQLIFETLRDNGFITNVSDTDGTNQICFLSQDQNKRLDAVRQRASINIEQKHIMRLPKESK